MSTAIAKAHAALRKNALTYPGAVEEFPWGECVIKVRGRIFVFLGKGEGLSMSVKLPQSADVALAIEGSAPTPYGLGQHGWVSLKFAKGSRPPVPLLRAFIDESYRAVAPKRLVATLTSA